MVEQHLSTAHGLAAGLRVRPGGGEPMAAALAAYRFYHNDRASLPQLAAPLLAHARQAARTACRQWALVVHDWSPLHYTHHASKADRITLFNKNDHGYLLQTALLLAEQDGAPVAPLYLGLEAADGVHSTRRASVLPRRPELDELNRTMGYVEQCGLARPVVHILDRQGDSVLHLRRFARCRRTFLIRGNDVRRVEHAGGSRLLSEVEATLAAQFQRSRTLSYRGQRVQQYVAATTVTLTGPARLQRRRAGRLTYRKVAGRPLPLRLVLTELRDAQDRVLTRWRLWTNLPPSVPAATVAQWYYWRWRIESYHQLLKRGGQHVEQWQQAPVAAVAKRLAVAAQACVIVWALLAAPDPAHDALRAFLVRQSGRLMKRGVKYTGPALLAGLWNLLAILDALDQYTVAELQQLGQQVKQMLGLA